MFKTLIARQFRRPAGFLGIYAANFMKKNNQDYITHTVELLEIQDNDAILEIGCGAGYAIQTIIGKNNRCAIDAIDFSAMMLKKAKQNTRRFIESNRIRFIKGDFCDHKFNGAAYSKIFAINVVYFWKDLNPVFLKINSLLKTGGRLVLFMSSPERLLATPFGRDAVFNKYTLDQVEAHLSHAGFSGITHEKLLRAGFETYYIGAGK